MEHNLLNSPYYIVEEVIPKNSAEVNPNHQEVKGCRCTLVSVHVGRGAQLLVDFEWDDKPHMYRTSTVQYCSMAGDSILIGTMNSTYILRKENEF